MEYSLMLNAIACIFLSLAANYAHSEQAPCETPDSKAPGPSSMTEIYRKAPFKSGERSTFQVHYMGVMVGYGNIRVKPPVLLKNNWSQHFSAKASTGDWYSAIFVAKDQVIAYSKPESFAVLKFYIKQDEGQMFGSRFIQEKWLNFYHEKCMVDEIIKKKDKEPVQEQAELSYGAIDALGAVFKLRSLTYITGQKQRFLVYSSRKNWWLEADPKTVEKVTVPAGEYLADKLKLQTYLGKDLQQKGEVHIWIAKDHPSRPLVKVEGEIKIGSIVMELTEFTPGSPVISRSLPKM